MSNTAEVRRLLVARNEFVWATQGVPNVEHLARAEQVFDLLVAGANAGMEGFQAAVERVYAELRQPTTAEIAVLARAVAPSTRARREDIVAVLESRVAGASWKASIASTYVYSDTTAKRWGELAARSQPRFAAALRVAVDGQSNGGEAGESSVVPSN